MTDGHFEGGVWVEDPANPLASIDDTLLIVGVQFALEYRRRTGKDFGVVWVQAKDGTLVAVARPDYAKKVHQFIKRLK